MPHRPVAARAVAAVWTLVVACTLPACRPGQTEVASPAYRLTLAAAPGQTVADGHAAVTLTATLADASGAPVVGANVALAVDDAASVLLAAAPDTDASGQLTATLTARTPGVKTTVASWQGLTASAVATFVVGPLVASRSGIAASPAVAIADGTAAVQVEVALRDGLDNPIPDVPVQLSTDAPAVLAATAGTTGARGTFGTTLASAAVGPVTVVAEAAGSRWQAAVTFAPGPPVAAGSTLAVTPATVPADGHTRSTLTLTVRDAHAHVVPGVAVTLGTDVVRDYFLPTATGHTDAAGTFAASFAPTGAGPRQVAAHFDGQQVQAATTATAAPQCLGTPSWGGPPALTVGSGPTGVALGDVDGDGVTDLVVGHCGDSNLMVFLGHHNGVFSPPSTVARGAVQCLRAVALDDLDHDGVLDVVATATGTPGVVTYHGQGGGTFAAPILHPQAAPPPTLAIADLDGDGYDDIVTPGSGTGSLAVFAGASTGLAAARTVPVAGAGALVDVRTADLDGDGIVDFLAVDGQNGALYVGRGHGDGTFGPATATPHGVAHPVSLSLADVDADGHLDVVVPDPDNPNMALLRGGGDGTFAAPSFVAAVWPSSSVAVGDVSGDGIADLVAMRQTGDIFQSLNGHGDGTFSTLALLWTARTQPWARDQLLGDFDGDHAPDLVMPMYDDGLVVLFRRESGNIVYPHMMGTSFRALSLVARDFDGDGALDLASGDDGHTVAFARGDGHGGMATPVAIAGVGASFGLTSGDLNGDGKWDLVVGSVAGPGITVLLGHGDGSFAAPAAYATDASPVPLVVDVDGDSIPDVVVPALNGAVVNVLLGHGDGTLAAPIATACAATPVTPTAADFDGDGHVDIAVLTNSGTPVVQVLLGTGDGHLAAHAQLPFAALAGDLAHGDLDGDGHVDLVAAAADVVYVWRGLGDGTFAAPTVVDAASGGCQSLAVGDVNGDGHLDIVAAASNKNMLHVMLGHGDGSFAAAVAYNPNLKTPTTVVLGDFDGDGRVDLASSGYNSFALAVMVASECLP